MHQFNPTAPRFAAAGVLALALLSGGCRSALSQAPAAVLPQQEADRAALLQWIEELYVAFSFDPGAPPDWVDMRVRFLEGANFVPPIGAAAPVNAQDTETFLASFSQYVSQSSDGRSGLHELILDVQLEIVGDIAHAFVLFEGVVPTSGERRTLGVDSLQLVRTSVGWRLASFSTQYDRPDHPLPARYAKLGKPPPR